MRATAHGGATVNGALQALGAILQNGFATPERDNLSYSSGIAKLRLMKTIFIRNGETKVNEYFKEKEHMTRSIMTDQSTNTFLSTLRRKRKFLITLTMLIIANMLLWVDVFSSCNATSQKQQSVQSSRQSRTKSH
jgi:hypothetical protein